MRSDMEYLRIMRHFCIHACSICAITHETNTILGLLLGSDDLIHNMAAQLVGRNIRTTYPPSSHVQQWYSF